MDLEAWEFGLRAAVLAAGARMLETLIDGIGSGSSDNPVLCECGHVMESRGRKEKELLTILGPVSYKRSLFQCAACGKNRFPGDEALDVVNTTRSPGLRRMMARAGSRSTFKEGCADLKVYAGITVSAKDVERVAESVGHDMERWLQQERRHVLQTERPTHPLKNIAILYVSFDGTGVPMTRQELHGRKGKQQDGSAKTREAKLGCVFTQTTNGDDGKPIRDPDSTTFVGAIEPAAAFGERIYAEAVRRGSANAHRVVVLGDGAEWIKGIAEMYFPSAVHIVDLYHAREHVSQLCKLLYPADNKQAEEQRERWYDTLDAGDIERIVAEARAALPRSGDRRKKAATEIAYLEKNKERMRYAEFRAKHLFVGSGVVEAGCRTVIGQRLKQSGMEWSQRGANAIIALRCVMTSGRLEDYWESKVA